MKFWPGDIIKNNATGKLRIVVTRSEFEKLSKISAYLDSLLFMKTLDGTDYKQSWNPERYTLVKRRKSYLKVRKLP